MSDSLAEAIGERSNRLADAIALAMSAKEVGEKVTVSQLAKFTGYGPGMLSSRLQSQAIPLKVPGVTWGREFVLAPLMIWRTEEPLAVERPKCRSGRHEGKGETWQTRATFNVQYRGMCRDSIYSCTRCLPGIVRALSVGCTHDEHPDREPGILHVEVL